jgi:selenocysteine-specific elongation factor
VLRSCSPASTIGGGHVLDAHPLPNLRKAKCLSWLEALKSASLEEQLFMRVARRGVAGLTLRELVAETGLTLEALQRITQSLISSKRLLNITGDMQLTSEAAEIATSNIAVVLKKDAKADGLKRSELKSQTGLRTEIFDFLLEKLVGEQKLRLQNERIYLAASRPHLADADLESHFAIASIYEAAGLAAPSFSEVATRLNLKEREMRRLMTFLLREKVLIKMGTDEVYIHNSALERLRDQVRDLRGQTVDVAHFKQLTGLSRKYAIPLLEYLDRERITRKVGDKHLVL